jgi:FxsC-like protein
MYFFFSYSRQNNDSFLREFFDELNQTVKELVGERSDTGFFDQKGLELGEFWEKDLEQALISSRVFIATVTAGYAKSDFCGKEWAAFQYRLAAYAKQHNSELPPLMLPLFWNPSEEPLPATIMARQYTYGNPTDIYNVKGLKYMCKLKQRYTEEHMNYIDALARKIVALSKQYADLDQIAELPTLAHVESAFGTPSSTGTGSAQPRTVAKGPKRVYFVFGAAKGTEVVQAGKTIIDAYGASGGEEWQPYFPRSRNIGSIAMQTAATDELGLWANQLEMSPALPDKIRNAEKQRELVILFVDGWTSALPQYRSALQAFDQQNYINCSVMVPWNDQDPETKNNHHKLLGALKTALLFRCHNQNDLYYRAPIKTEEELRAQLADVLTRLRAEVINKSLPDPGAVPQGGSQPVISGPGS